MKLRPNTKIVNMKIRILLTSISAAAVAALAFDANASGAYLSPRAAGSQSQHFAGTYSDPNLVNTTGIVVITPRAAGNQAVANAGANTETAPAVACARMMTATPKGVQACAEHPATMPGCNVTVAASTK